MTAKDRAARDRNDFADALLAKFRTDMIRILIAAEKQESARLTAENEGADYEHSAP